MFANAEVQKIRLITIAFFRVFIFTILKATRFFVLSYTANFSRFFYTLVHFSNILIIKAAFDVIVTTRPKLKKDYSSREFDDLVYFRFNIFEHFRFSHSFYLIKRIGSGLKIKLWFYKVVGQNYRPRKNEVFLDRLNFVI